MNSLSLFYNGKERALFFILLAAVFSVNLLLYYKDFKTLKEKNVVFKEATVVKQYQKENRHGKYWVLKLEANDGYSFYTTSKEDLKNIKNRSVTVGFLTKDLDFLSFLKGFYARSVFLTLDEPCEGAGQSIKKYITDQHQSEKLSEFYGAIFTGTPISKALREDVTNLGIAHLIAISGFHIGIVIAIIALLVLPLYRFLHSRYFPYRNRYLDLYLFTDVVILGYLAVTGFIPSLIRAYTMYLFGGFFLFRNIKILSYENLLVVGLVLIAIFPKLLFSLGFFFSMAGVFYIYLVVDYVKVKNKFLFSLILSVLLFIYMLPLTYYFFHTTSYYQLLSPFLTMGFTLFYPVSIFLHGVGLGELLDGIVSWVLNIKGMVWETSVSSGVLYCYIVFSLLSVKRKEFFYLFSLLSFVLFGKFFLAHL